MSVQKNSTATPATKPILNFAACEHLSELIDCMHSLFVTNGTDDVSALDSAITSKQMKMGADLAVQARSYLNHRYEHQID